MNEFRKGDQVAILTGRNELISIGRHLFTRPLLDRGRRARGSTSDRFHETRDISGFLEEKVSYLMNGTSQILNHSLQHSPIHPWTGEFREYA